MDGINDFQEDIAAIRAVLRTDTRTTYEIARLAGLSNTVVAAFRLSDTKVLSVPTLKQLVPVIMPGRNYGIAVVLA